MNDEEKDAPKVDDDDVEDGDAGETCVPKDRPSETSIETDELVEQAKSEVPPSGNSRDADIVVVWNKLCDKLGLVVKTIQKNEPFVRRMAWVVVIAVLIGIGSDVWHKRQHEIQSAEQIQRLEVQRVEELKELAKKHEATLTAVLKLGEALGKKIEADAKPSVQADEEVEVAALDAQKAALEAKKEVADSYAEKAQADRAIKEVELKKAIKKNGADKKYHGWDDEALSTDKPYDDN